MGRPLRSWLPSKSQGQDSTACPQPGGNRDSLDSCPVTPPTTRLPGCGAKAVGGPLSRDKRSPSQEPGVRGVPGITRGSGDTTAERSSHLRARPGCAARMAARALAAHTLPVYLLAPCGCGGMPTAQPGPQSSSISGSSRLLGQQPGQILSEGTGSEAGWVINGEQELRYRAQQAILG